MEFRGFLEEIITEAGTGGVIWALRDPGLPEDENIHPLEQADELRVFDDAGGALWEGKVDFTEIASRPCRPPGGDFYDEDVRGAWVHGMPADVDPALWRRMFADRRRAVLRRDPLRPGDRPPHPFSGPVEGLHERLAALPKTRAEKLFREAFDPWFWLDAEDTWRSLAQDWGLDPVETVALLANASPEQAPTWKTWIVRGPGKIPPSFLQLLERLGLLFGVNAALLWGLPDVLSRLYWLSMANPGLNGQAPLDLLVSGGPGETYWVLKVARASLYGEEATAWAEEGRHRAAVEALDAESRQHRERVLSHTEHVASDVLVPAVDILGSRENAADWLMRPLAALGQVRPMDLLGTVAGRDQVLLLLTRLRYGVYV